MTLVTCRHAFRLRRLAQSVRPRSGLNLVCGILPVNFRLKWLLWNLDMHFACARSHKVCVRVLGPICGPRHFPCKFPYKVALLMSPVTCRHEFRLCRLAPKVCVCVCVCRLLGRGIFPLIFPMKWLFWWLLWHVDMHFHCAGSHKMCVCVRVLSQIWAATFIIIIITIIIIIIITRPQHPPPPSLHHHPPRFHIHFIFRIIILIIIIIIVIIIIHLFILSMAVLAPSSLTAPRCPQLKQVVRRCPQLLLYRGVTVNAHAVRSRGPVSLCSACLVLSSAKHIYLHHPQQHHHYHQHHHHH